MASGAKGRWEQHPEDAEMFSSNLALPGGRCFQQGTSVDRHVNGTGIISVWPDLIAVTKEHSKSQDLSAINLLEKPQQLLWPLHIEFVIL